MVNAVRNSVARALDAIPAETERPRALRKPMPLVLLVDADNAARRRLHGALREQGFRVVEATSGAEGIVLASGHNPDLVVVADAPPGIQAIDLTSKLRAWSAAPIFVVSEQSSEDEMVATLDAGANDYLSKPVGTPELLARMRVWLRHSLTLGTEGQEAILEVGPVRVDLDKRIVYVGGVEVHFTPIEYKLLTTFLRSPGKVLTHEDILVSVWGAAYARETQYLRVFVGQLRHKIEPDPARPRLLLTQSGVGYRLRAD